MAGRQPLRTQLPVEGGSLAGRVYCVTFSVEGRSDRLQFGVGDHVRRGTVRRDSLRGWLGIGADSSSRFAFRSPLDECSRTWVVEARATVLHPVSQLGALLYIGDGHAAQGDGERTGDVMETSMAVRFTVELIRWGFQSNVRARDAQSLMSLGVGGEVRHSRCCAAGLRGGGADSVEGVGGGWGGDGGETAGRRRMSGANARPDAYRGCEDEEVADWGALRDAPRASVIIRSCTG